MTYFSFIIINFYYIFKSDVFIILKFKNYISLYCTIGEKIILIITNDDINVIY